MTKARRRRLVEADGVECFEVRVVHWLDQDGHAWTSAEITTPDTIQYPSLAEALGALEIAKDLVREDYAEPVSPTS